MAACTPARGISARGGRRETSSPTINAVEYCFVSLASRRTGMPPLGCSTAIARQPFLKIPPFSQAILSSVSPRTCTLKTAASVTSRYSAPGSGGGGRRKGSVGASRQKDLRCRGNGSGPRETDRNHRMVAWRSKTGLHRLSLSVSAVTTTFPVSHYSADAYLGVVQV